MTEDEVRERARQRLAERQNRFSQHVPNASSRSVSSSRERIHTQSSASTRRHTSHSERPSRTQDVMPDEPSSSTVKKASSSTVKKASSSTVEKVLFTCGRFLFSLFYGLGVGLADFLRSIVWRFGARGIVVFAALLLVVVLGVVGLRSCAGCSTSASDPQVAAPQQENPVPENPPIDSDFLLNLLGSEVGNQLIEKAETNEDIAWIASHPDQYAKQGKAVQEKLLKLAALELEAVPLVRAYPQEYSQNTAEPSPEVTQGEIPMLYQWDSRWGNTEYSSAPFALSGCCPTSFAMVYQGLTGKNDLSPYDMALLAREKGYESEYDGTVADFLVYEAPNLGLTCLPVLLNKDSLRSVLDDDYVVICNVGPGDFTETGHFFVIVGINEDGTLKINDPYSSVRSAKNWDSDLVISQTRSLWAYKLA